MPPGTSSRLPRFSRWRGGREGFTYASKSPSDSPQWWAPLPQLSESEISSLPLLSPWYLGPTPTFKIQRCTTLHLTQHRPLTATIFHPFLIQQSKSTTKTKKKQIKQFLRIFAPYFCSRLLPLINVVKWQKYPQIPHIPTVPQGH